MPSPPAVAGPSTSTATGPRLALPLQQPPPEPTPPPPPRELPPPKRKICPEYIVDRLERDWRRKRHAAIRNSCMKLQARFIPPVKRRPKLFSDGQLAEMTEELLILQGASAGTRLVAAEQGNTIFRLTGLERPPEEKPKRFKLQRKERVDYQRIHLARNFDLTPIAPKLAVERTPKERIMAMVKPQRSLLPPATPSTPPVIAAVELETNGRADDDSPETPPLATTKGKRKVAQLLSSALLVTPVEIKEKLEKKPKKDSAVKKRTSNRLSKTPRVSTKEEEELTYCFCSRVSFGEMVACDNEKCEIEWFHFECIGLTAKPKGKWFCPNCRQPEQSPKPIKPGTAPSTPKVGNFPAKENDIENED